MTKIIYMMSWFGLKEWKFANCNIKELYAQLTPAEKKLLEFDIETIDWTTYFHSYLSGIRKYFFKDSDNKLHKRKALYRR